MKYFLVLLALSTSAFATPIPSELVCTSKATSENVRTFSLTGLNTTEPDATIMDSGFMGMEVADGMLEMGFSNECDNSYGVKIELSQIEELMEGKRKTITGKLTYSDVALSEARDTEEEVEETVEITCRLK